jgi:hypothetical protein
MHHEFATFARPIAQISPSIGFTLRRGPPPPAVDL